MTPTAKQVQKIFPQVSQQDSARIRALMLTAPPFRGIEEALQQISTILGGYGVEVVNGPAFHRGYWAQALLVYVNTGDTYSSTIGYETPAVPEAGPGRFMILPGGWGSWVEWYEQKHGPLE